MLYTPGSLTTGASVTSVGVAVGAGLAEVAAGDDGGLTAGVVSMNDDPTTEVALGLAFP